MALYQSPRSFSVRIIAASTLMAGVAFSNAVFAQESKPVAKVGEVTITEADLDQAMKDMADQFARVPEAERKARALDSLIDFHVLAAAARKAGIDKDPEVMRRVELLRIRALHNGYFEKKVQTAVTDAELKARFDREMAAATPEKEVKARHILVKTEDEAKAIIKELEGGADFVELAKKKSTGPSGPNGGDLGFFGAGRMVPAFEEAAFKLEKGGYTKDPVRTQFGFHVIKVDETRNKPLPTFEASKQQLRQLMLTEAYTKSIEEQRKAVGAEILDEALKLKKEP